MGICAFLYHIILVISRNAMLARLDVVYSSILAVGHSFDLPAKAHDAWYDNESTGTTDNIFDQISSLENKCTRNKDLG